VAESSIYIIHLDFRARWYNCSTYL